MKSRFQRAYRVYRPTRRRSFKEEEDLDCMNHRLVSGTINGYGVVLDGYFCRR